MKKQLKYLILVFPIILISSFGKAQNHEAHYKLGDRALVKTMNETLGTLMKSKKPELCANSVMFAIFRILPSGKISPITFVGDENDISIKEMLKDVLNSTDGNWIPKKTNGKAVESGRFVLPLLYDLEAGCRGKKISNNSNEILKIFFDSPQLSQNPSDAIINCVILKPLSVFSIN